VGINFGGGRYAGLDYTGGRHGIAAHPALASGNLFNIDH
jgi:hypothetical protein